MLIGNFYYLCKRQPRLNMKIDLRIDNFLPRCIDVLILVLATFVALKLTGYYSFFEMNVALIKYLVLCSLLISMIVLGAVKIGCGIVRLSNLRDIGVMFRVALLKVGLLIVALVFICLKVNANLMPMSQVTIFVLFDVLISFAALVLSRVLMAKVEEFLRRRGSDRPNVMVFGINKKGIALARRIESEDRFRVRGLCDFLPDDYLFKINGAGKYYFTEECANEILVKFRISAIIFSDYSSAKQEKERLVKLCEQNQIQVLVQQPFELVPLSDVNDNAPRELKIEELLERNLIEIDKSEVGESFRGKTVLVTGAAGSIGAELCHQLISLGVKRLIMYDSAETPIHQLKLELSESSADVEFIPIIADVRMKVRLRSVFKSYHPDVVFHAAAYKHVPLMEDNPSEAVLLNVLGSKNVADLCLEYGTEKMVMISSDKAVNPTNVMGASKRIAEIYVQSLGVAIERGVVAGNTKFITTRFGNVLGSNGSVIPLFQEQIAKGGPITVTHPEITRYFMTIPEACKLVMKAASMGKGNEIFVFDMGKPVKIVDLANKMIELAGLVPNEDIKISYIGLRPGEKLYEELLADKESTIPTPHEKILIAKVRECDFGDMSVKIRKLIRLAFLSENEETIILMKQIVPEYLSAESKYMKYD